MEHSKGRLHQINGYYTICRQPCQAFSSFGGHAPFVSRGTAVPCRGTAVLCPYTRRLSPVLAGEVRRGGPSAQLFFQPFPCPVKYVRFHRAGPARPQSTHVPSRESREKAWSQDFLEGRPHPASPAPQGRGPSRPPLEMWRAPLAFFT
jgi:hypothetical protein